MNYKKELTKFIEQKILNQHSLILKTNNQMNHINSDYPREELIAAIKNGTRSLNGVFINLFGDKYLKKEYTKIKREQIAEEIKKIKAKYEEYVDLLECLDKERKIKINETTIDIIVEFAQSHNLKYEEFIELLKDLKLNQLEINEVISIISQRNLKEYALYINWLVNEHEINTKKKDRKELLEQKDKLGKLREYYSNGIIIKPTNSIEEFESILKEVDLPEAIKTKMISSMEIAIENKQLEEYRNTAIKVIRSIFSERYILNLEEAEKILKENKNNPLYNLIKKAYKNILSLCKYLSLLPEGISEWANILERLDAEIINLRNIIEISEIKELFKDMKYHYLLKEDKSLQIKEDIDFIEETNYGEIAISLDKLQKGTTEKEQELNINGFKVRITEGTVNIAYVEIEGIKIIIATAQNSIKERLKERLNSNRFISNLKNQIRLLKEDPEEIRKTRLYHEVIMRNLDIYSPPGYSFK